MKTRIFLSFIFCLITFSLVNAKSILIDYIGISRDPLRASHIEQINEITNKINEENHTEYLEEKYLTYDLAKDIFIIGVQTQEDENNIQIIVKLGAKITEQALNELTEVSKI